MRVRLERTAKEGCGDDGEDVGCPSDMSTAARFVYKLEFYILLDDDDPGLEFLARR